jgi:hypothetical protein
MVIERFNYFGRSLPAAPPAPRSGRLGSIEESAEIMGWLITYAADERFP